MAPVHAGPNPSLNVPAFYNAQAEERQFKIQPASLKGVSQDIKKNYTGSSGNW